MSTPAQQTLVPFRAPARLAHFPPPRALIGREPDITRVTHLIERGERLITVLGPPGIGKTSLATAVAERLSVRLPAWFCDLSQERSPAALTRHVLALMGEAGRPAADAGEVLAQLGPAMLVLDNFEQLIGASATLLGWWHRAPELIVVVTSRERLAIECECVAELEPLALPGDTASGAEATTSSAVQLFQLRAAAAGAKASPDVDSVAAIVRHLDGIPLAIELAAARTRLMPPKELAARLRAGGDLLTLAKRSPERHRTLADAIAWSWELLTPDEQRLLAACSVFKGSFSVSAAERVLGAALADVAVVDGLAQLREKSLVHVVAEGRLGLYASIQEFAAGMLHERYPELTDRVARAHARAFAELALAFVGSRLLLRHANASAHGGVQRDMANLVAALDHVEAAPSAPESAELAHERATLAAQLAAALAFLEVYHRAKRPLEAALACTPPLSPTLLAMVHLARQKAFARDGRFDAAEQEAHRVIDGLSVPDEVRAAALLRIGILRREDGATADALAAHERVAALIDGAASPLEAVNTACLGRLMCDLRRSDDAYRLNEQAAALCERLGETWLAALARANIAQLEQEQGELERAEATLERAVACFRDAGEPHYEGFYAAICGGLYFEWGRHDLARHWYALSERPIESVSRAFAQVMLRAGWAALEAIVGDSQAALAQLEHAQRSLARCPGALARILVEVHATTVAVALGTLSESQRQRARERAAELAEGRTTEGAIASNNLDTRFALRILQRALHTRTTRLRVKRGGHWFRVDDAEPVDLSRRSSLRRLVHALAETHASEPGGALDAAALFAHGWPGQHIQLESAGTRVRVAIATLRKLGLREVLLTRDEGYLFDPAVMVALTD